MSISQATSPNPSDDIHPLTTARSHFIQHRARGRDILLNPTYFSENARVFADAVAAQGAHSVAKTMSAVRQAQGIPLRVVESTLAIAGTSLAPAEVQLLKRLAQDGIVKPPSITTPHAGENFFLFTPTPGDAALSPTKRDIYERAMAIVAAVRQGQYLAKEFAIRDPAAVLHRLMTDLRLGKATTEARQQYKNLVHLRIGVLIPKGSGYAEFHVIDTKENREALRIAYSLVSAGQGKNLEIDEDARSALQRDQTFVESLISAGTLRERLTVKLDEEQAHQLDLLLLGGGAS